MRKLVSVEDYRQVARRRLPKVVFDYIDGGAESESTVLLNRAAFESVTLRPQGGMDPERVDTATSILGNKISMPVIVAPCGAAHAVNSIGDKAGVMAAAAKGTIFVQSTLSGHPVAELVEAAKGSPVWYQAYRVGDRATADRAIARARDAGAQALVVTIDTAVVSLRERDDRSGGMALLGRSKFSVGKRAPKLVLHPRWLLDRVSHGVYPKFMNVLDENGTPGVLGRAPDSRGLTWEDMAWVRKTWGDGPIVIKGVLTTEDARRSLEMGAAAIVVSNHGGRQLDGADASLRMLPEIADFVSKRCEVIVDGGVRSSIDVLKALCLGADAVQIGRPWLFGLAVAGQAGVEGVLQLFLDGVARNLALLGATKPSDLDLSYARAPEEWFVPSRTQRFERDPEELLGLGLEEPDSTSYSAHP
jgi:isopentenyl diphosphate isomerase/L-lactate dehydrogenase-like FMN-dependent dehydrogenase